MSARVLREVVREPYCIRVEAAVYVANRHALEIRAGRKKPHGAMAVFRIYAVDVYVRDGAFLLRALDVVGVQRNKVVVTCAAQVGYLPVMAMPVEVNAVHVEPQRIPGRVVERYVVYVEIRCLAECDSVQRRIAHRKATHGDALDICKPNRNAEERVVLVMLRQRRRPRRLEAPVLRGIRRLVEVGHVPNAAGQGDTLVRSVLVAAVFNHGAVRLRGKSDDGKAIQPQFLVGADLQRLGYEIAFRGRRQIDAAHSAVEPRLNGSRIVYDSVTDKRRERLGRSTAQDDAD